MEHLKKEIGRVAKALGLNPEDPYVKYYLTHIAFEALWSKLSVTDILEEEKTVLDEYTKKDP